MKIIRILRKRIKDIQPNNQVLDEIKAQCGISVSVNAKTPFYKRRIYKMLMPVMACLLLSVNCASIVFTLPKNSSTTSYILLELGSQVQFVAQDDVVVEQQALNPEAQILLLGCDYVDSAVDEAIVDVVNNAETLGMIAPGDDINISTVVSSNVDSKSSICKGLNSAQNELSKSYQLNSTISDRGDLLDSVAVKYACSEQSIDDKNIADLIKIYVNFDSLEHQEFEYNLNSQYENIWEQMQADMNSDSAYNEYKDLSQNLYIIIVNLQILQSDYDQKMYETINEMIQNINGNYDNMLGEFNINPEFALIVQEKCDYVNDEINKKIESYHDWFEQEVLDYKRSMFNEIYGNNLPFNLQNVA